MKIKYFLLVLFSLALGSEDRSVEGLVDKTATLALSPSKEITPRLAHALFRPEAINDVIFNAIYAENKAVRMSLYEAKESTTTKLVLAAINHQRNLSASGLKELPSLRALVCGKSLENKDYFHDFCVSLLRRGVKVRQSNNVLQINTNKETLHQKFWLFDDAYQGRPIALIGSFNPTAHANAPYQFNNLAMVAIPNIVTELRKRFNLIFNQRSEAITTKLKSIKPKTNYTEEDIDEISFDEYNLRTTDTDKVKLLKSPLWDTQQSISEEIIDAIDNEQEAITFMHFQFSHAGVAKALARAIKRGVKVELLVDRAVLSKDEPKNWHHCAALAMQLVYSEIYKSTNGSYIKLIGNEPPKSGYRPGYMLHNKCGCFHGSKRVITGSWNCSGNSDLFCVEANISVEGDEEFYQQFINEKQDILNKAENMREVTDIDSDYMKQNSSFLDMQKHKEKIESKQKSYMVNGYALKNKSITSAVKKRSDLDVKRKCSLI